jgi:hypothetical protein
MPSIKLQVRRDTSASWSSSNPPILSGELGFEIDTGRVKIGRLITQNWNDIPYITTAISSIAEIPGLISALNLKADLISLNNLATVVDSKIDTTQLTALQTYLEGIISDAIASMQTDISNSASTQTDNSLAMIIALGD